MFLWLFLWLVAAQQNPEEDVAIEGSVVVDITAEDLGPMIQLATTEGNKALLINFFAPWCSHCKGLAPQYSEAAKELEATVVFAKFDCVLYKDECEARGIGYYPSLHFYHAQSGEKGEEYPGKTDGGVIRNWVQMHFEEPWVNLQSQAEVDDFVAKGLENKQLVLLGSLSDPNALKQFKVFLSQLYMNSKAGKYRFGLVDPQIGGQNAVTLHTVFDAGKYSTELSKDKDLHAWVRNHELPIFGEVVPKDFDLYKEKKVPLLLAFLSKASVHYDTWVKDITAVAEEFRGQILFGRVDLDVYKELATRLGITTFDLPGVVLTNAVARKHYPLHQEYTADRIREHCKQFLKGKLAPLSRTQTKQSPERWIQESTTRETGGTGIKDVDTATWDAIVKDTSKHVLVFFDAPWCKECRLLRDKYPRVASHFSNRTDVVVATVDVSANEGGFEVPENLPGLVFFPTDNKAGIPYLGPRDLEDLKFFVGQKVEEADKAKAQGISAVLAPAAQAKEEEQAKKKESEQIKDIEFPEHDEI